MGNKVCSQEPQQLQLYREEEISTPQKQNQQVVLQETPIEVLPKKEKKPPIQVNKFVQKQNEDISVPQKIIKRINSVQPLIKDNFPSLDFIYFFLTKFVYVNEPIKQQKNQIRILINNLHLFNDYYLGVHEEESSEQNLSELTFKHFNQILNKYQNDFLQQKVLKQLETIQKEQSDEYQKQLVKQQDEKKLKKFQLQQEGKQQAEEPKEEEEQPDPRQSEEDILLNLISVEDNLQKIVSFNNYLTQFNSKLSTTLNSKKIDSDKLRTQLPVYLCKLYDHKLGFQLWLSMFGSAIRVGSNDFIYKYSQVCKIQQGIYSEKLIKFIQKYNDRNSIDLFEYLHIVENSKDLVDEKGRVLYQTLSSIIHDDEMESDEIYKIQVESKEEQKDAHKNNHQDLNGKQVLSFQGITYTGLFKNDLFDGQGKITFPDNSSYEGEFQSGYYHGIGKFIDEKQNIILGNWSSGVLIEGKIIYSDQTQYQGQLISNRFRHGRGTLQNSQKQLIFSGNWNYDQPSNGKLYYQNQDKNQVIFEGETANWTISGNGTLYYQAENEGVKFNYKGDVANGLKNGKGSLSMGEAFIDGQYINDEPYKCSIYLDKSKKYYIEGEWSNFNLIGESKIVFNNEDEEEYVGQVKDFLRHGQGTQTYKNGDKYVGQWAYGLKSGEGVLNIKKGEEKYTGTFLKGKFEGNGTYNYSNGQKYQGKWKNGKWNGVGTLSDKNNVIKEGVWQDDKFYSDK